MELQWIPKSSSEPFASNRHLWRTKQPRCEHKKDVQVFGQTGFWTGKLPLPPLLEALSIYFFFCWWDIIFFRQKSAKRAMIRGTDGGDGHLPITCLPSPAELVARFLSRTKSMEVKGWDLGKTLMARSRKVETRLGHCPPSVPTMMTSSFLVPQKPPLEILRWIPQEGNVGNAPIFKSTEARRGST